MIKFESLETIAGVSIFDVIKEYNIIEYVYNNNKHMNLKEIKKELELIDFVGDVYFYTDAEKETFIDVLTDIIRVDISIKNGIEPTFLIYYASADCGDILTYTMSKYDIEKTLNTIDIVFN